MIDTTYFVAREERARLGGYRVEYGDVFYSKSDADARAKALAAEHRGQKVFVFAGAPVSAFRAEPVAVESLMF